MFTFSSDCAAEAITESLSADRSSVIVLLMLDKSSLIAFFSADRSSVIVLLRSKVAFLKLRYSCPALDAQRANLQSRP